MAGPQCLCFSHQENGPQGRCYSSPATDLLASSAKGWLTYDGAAAELKFATAFVDQKDEREPIVLVISDQKLPGEK